MKFYSTPNMYVKFTPRHKRMFHTHGLYFGTDGTYETENEVLIQLLKTRFKHEEPQPELEISASPSETIRHCKKCEFTCETQGELLRHYRECHPKPKEE